VKSKWPVFLLVFATATFALGLWHLFRLRFETGDVYPPYSSLRADPLGTMAFYESLARLPGISVSRDFTEANRLPPPAGTTYLHLAARSHDWDRLPEALFREIEGFVLRGGRLVVAFYPEAVASSGFLAPAAAGRPSPAKGGPPAKKRKTTSAPEGSEKWFSLEERWGISLGHLPLEAGPNDRFEPVRVYKCSELPLPAELAWHSAIIFTNLQPGWSTLYARSNNAVLIEKRLGAGSIVLASDTYFLSNEALLREPEADLLAWLVGSATSVVFDEAHFGIVEQAGVATLLRQYQLEWALVSLLLLAGLFVWKNATSLAPPQAPPGELNQVAGRDAAAGFINLLRRSVAPTDLLRVCFEKWTDSLGAGAPLPITKVDQAQALIETELARPRRLQEPVRVYREICAVLKSRQH
jgi:hypothetical protein